MAGASPHLVFIPSPGIGHIASTVEFVKILAGRDQRLSITVLVMKFPSESDTVSSYSEGPKDRIRFIDLPHDDLLKERLSKPNVSFMTEFVNYHKPVVRKAINELITESTRPACVVVDMFCTQMIEVAEEFGLPSYAFYTSSAATLGLIFHVQTLYAEHHRVLSELTELSIPSFVNSVPVKVLPYSLMDDKGGRLDLFLNMARGFRKVKGILVNTFTELESHAIESIKSDEKAPPIYPVGPILNLGSRDASRSDQSNDIISWLDNQPPSSVLFLCFGSNGCFENDQVREIARALELSGKRFLWSLRKSPQKGVTALSNEEYVTNVLTEGFLERTSKIGKVIGWAPQVTVLAHPSVGGFVSHCGWNSVLESLWYGVPVATWPLYAEQQVNAFQMLKDLGLAVEIKMDYKMGGDEIVAAEEIEKAIGQLMDGDPIGCVRLIKQKVKETSEKSRLAVKNDGFSYNSIGKFIEDAIGNVN